MNEETKQDDAEQLPPLPWTVFSDADGQGINDGDGITIVRLPAGGPNRSPAEAMAALRLIAAAPVLVAEVKRGRAEVEADAVCAMLQDDEGCPKAAMDAHGQARMFQFQAGIATNWILNVAATFRSKRDVQR